MRIIVLRHAVRERGDRATEEFIEKHLPLTPAGKQQARELGEEMLRRGLRPAVYFTSCFAHARQSGEILSNTAGGNSPAQVIELCTLTPHYQGPRAWRESGKPWKGADMLAAIDRETKLRQYDLRQLENVAFILHKPRLEQLLAAMTSQDEGKFRDLEYSQGVVVNAESLEAFLQGKGKEEGRLEAHPSTGVSGAS